MWGEIFSLKPSLVRNIKHCFSYLMSQRGLPRRKEAPELSFGLIAELNEKFRKWKRIQHGFLRENVCKIWVHFTFSLMSSLQTVIAVLIGLTSIVWVACFKLTEIPLKRLRSTSWKHQNWDKIKQFKEHINFRYYISVLLLSNVFSSLQSGTKAEQIGAFCL